MGFIKNLECENDIHACTCLNVACVLAVLRVGVRHPNFRCPRLTQQAKCSLRHRRSWAEMRALITLHAQTMSLSSKMTLI